MAYLYRKHNNNGANANKEYLINTIYDSIEDAAYAIRVNDQQLEERSATIAKVMRALRAAIIITTLSALVGMVCKFLI